MRVAAIFPPGRRDRYWQPFQQANAAEWTIGLPTCAKEADALIVFGGDGTIHRHLAEFVKLQIPLLIVPCGGGNDMARALGLRGRHDALAAWRNFCDGGNNIRAIDLGVIEQPAGAAPAPHYFGTVGCVGLDAEVARRSNLLPRWLRRRGGYVISLLGALPRWVPMKMNLEAEGCEPGAAERHSKPAILTAFANAPLYGGGMKIAPRARLDDGKLDICIVGKASKLKVLCLFPTVFFGRHLGIAEVEYFQAERLRLETGEPADVYADGEFVCRTPVKVTVARDVLKVIAPPPMQS